MIYKVLNTDFGGNGLTSQSHLCYNMLTLTHCEVAIISNIKMTDIARMAGVSLATVGRVIHQNGYVSEKNKIKIEQIIAEKGYVPNKIAQGLKSSRSNLIGHMTLFNINMLYEQIADSVNVAAHEQGYQVLTLIGHNDREEEKRQVDELIGHQVDGVIITSNPFISKESLDKFIRAHIPVVLVERTQNIPFVDCIRVDDFGGAHEAVNHMIKQGHTQIGYIGAKTWHEVETLRFEGYCSAIKEAGLMLSDEMIFFAENYIPEAGKMGAATLLEKENPPTAIFMTSDIFACGVMQYCYQKNIRIPDELSLIGYDNTLSALLSPPVTSMELPCGEIGKHALEMLEKRLKEYERKEQVIEISPVLVDRRTVLR